MHHVLDTILLRNTVSHRIALEETRATGGSEGAYLTLSSIPVPVRIFPMHTVFEY